MRFLLSAWRPRVVLGLTVLLFASACSKDTPAAPTATVISDSFSGTLNVLGSDSKNFTVVYAAGLSDASITVTALSTVSTSTALTTTIGVAFGIIAFDGSCSRSTPLTAPAASINQELTASGVFSPGTFCAQIFDSGTLLEPANYTFVVKHF